MPEVISELLKMGKQHVFVGQLQEGTVHEHEAAVRVARAVAREGLSLGEPSEGKATLRAAYDGMCTFGTGA